MLLERRTVSRKTPRDGRMEITPESAARLGALATEFVVATEAATGRGRLEEMPCGCAKGAGGAHVHHFVESPLLMALVPETTVLVELDDDAGALTVRVAAQGE